MECVQRVFRVEMYFCCLNFESILKGIGVVVHERIVYKHQSKCEGIEMLRERVFKFIEHSSYEAKFYKKNFTRNECTSLTV